LSKNQVRYITASYQVTLKARLRVLDTVRQRRETGEAELHPSFPNISG
jgi:hypothetical protein